MLCMTGTATGQAEVLAGERGEGDGGTRQSHPWRHSSLHFLLCVRFPMACSHMQSQFQCSNASVDEYLISAIYSIFALYAVSALATPAFHLEPSRGWRSEGCPSCRVTVEDSAEDQLIGSHSHRSPEALLALFSLALNRYALSKRNLLKLSAGRNRRLVSQHALSSHLMILNPGPPSTFQEYK